MIRASNRHKPQTRRFLLGGGILIFAIIFIYIIVSVNRKPMICTSLPFDQYNPEKVEASITRSKDVEKIKDDLKKLSQEKTPEIFPAPDFQYEGVSAIFIKSVPYKGKETRVFAWYGFPALKKGEKCPAMVLIHGGSGTAYPKWVRKWNEKGYGAIAIDTNGCVPIKDGEGENFRKVHSYAGPLRWGGFDQMDADFHDLWNYHGIAAVIFARKVLASFPQVDGERIGVTGISWGGYLALIAASVDKEFKCVSPVYASGFVGEESAWSKRLKEMGEKGNKWIQTWDTAVYLKDIHVPILWVSSVNDPYFSLSSLQKSYFLNASPSTLCLRIKMPHSQLHGRKPPEIAAFADTSMQNLLPFPQIMEQYLDHCTAVVKFRSQVSIMSAKLLYTKDTGPWKTRKWSFKEAKVNSQNQTASASLPEDTTAYIINITDAQNRMVSSEFRELTTR